ncbi:MAG: DUF4139 domain-containing protein [Bacteroidota bacterium]
MNKLFTLVAILLSMSLYSQEPIVSKGVIKQVTVFRKGAFASAEASVNVAKGVNKIEIKGLPAIVNRESIQVGGKGAFFINSVSYLLRTPDADTLEKSSKAFAIQTKIDSLSDVLQQIYLANTVIDHDYQLLLVNKTVKSQATGLKLLDLKAIMSYMAPKYVELKVAKLKNNERITLINNVLQRFRNELAQLSIKGKEELSVLVDLSAENSGSLDLSVDFLMDYCGWNPQYDIRSNGVSEKTNIAYKAEVWQNTGIDWKNVQITLSTGNPSQKNDYTKAVKRYYSLNYVPKKNYSTPSSSTQNVFGTRRTLSSSVNSISGKITDGNEPVPFANIIAYDESGRQFGGTQSDMDGNFKLSITPDVQFLYVSYVGYQTVKYYLTSSYLSINLNATTVMLESVQCASVTKVSLVDKKTAEKPQYEMVENVTNMEFKINTPYTILADNKPNQVEINSRDFDAQYEYYSAPELSKSAFLTAKITGLEHSGYESGPLNVFLNGSYVANSSLIIPSSNDTATVSFGVDKGVIVTRERLKNGVKNSNLGLKKEELFSYKNSFRNTKNAPIRMLIQEQVPVAKSNSVAVSDLNYTNATYDENTGILSWWITIKPKETVTISYKYTIAYA